ncbi:MAG: protein translocase subunit SecF [Clostridia bacterium]
MTKRKEFFNKFNIHLRELKIFQNAYYWFIVPLAIVFIALVCGTVYEMADTRYEGFANVGVDFKGGTVLTVKMTSADLINLNYDENVDLIFDLAEEHGVNISSIQTSGSDSFVLRYTNTVNGEDFNSAEKTADMITVNTALTKDIQDKLVEKYNLSSVSEVTVTAELINATASSEFVGNAFLAIGITILLTFIYIIVRFDAFSSIASLLSIIHDIIVMMAFVIIFNLPIGSTLIAGIITVVGFSINNTIVVFDRVRETLKPFKNKKSKIEPRYIVNTTVADTLTRSLFTIVSTMLTILVLAVVGVPALTEFSLPIIFGLAAGLYSSVFIAPTIWGLLMQAKQKKDSSKKSNYKKGTPQRVRR